jgi:hypothetical protein
MATMKANRCNRLSNNNSTISPSVTPPMIVTCTSILPIRNRRSNAWATRFENVLW